MKTVSIRIASLLIIGASILPSVAFARTLKEVMEEMAPAFKAMATSTAFDESTRLKADLLKKLALEAAALTPPNLPLAQQLDFEGLLLQVATKSNLIEQSILANDSTKAKLLVKEIAALRSEGHDKFIE
jgi:hypothetical protein